MLYMIPSGTGTGSVAQQVESPHLQHRTRTCVPGLASFLLVLLKRPWKLAQVLASSLADFLFPFQLKKKKGKKCTVVITKFFKKIAILDNEH